MKSGVPPPGSPLPTLFPDKVFFSPIVRHAHTAVGLERQGGNLIGDEAEAEASLFAPPPFPWYPSACRAPTFYGAMAFSICGRPLLFPDYTAAAKEFSYVYAGSIVLFSKIEAVGRGTSLLVNAFRSPLS